MLRGLLPHSVPELPLKQPELQQDFPTSSPSWKYRMCALPLVYVHVTAEYPPVLVLVQPQVQLQALILLQDLPQKLVLDLVQQQASA